MTGLTDPDLKEVARKLSSTEKARAIQKIKAREIVGEIARFGVTQHQILYIIRLLSLELENADLMRDLNDVIRMYQELADEDSGSTADLPKKTKIYM